MRILETARNIANAEEVETWLRETFAHRFPSLLTWLTTSVRKWVIKNAPVVDAPIVDTTGLPDWLRQAMRSTEKPQNVVLDDDLRLRIQDVLDYMNNLVQQRPDSNLASIGFDVAEQRSRKWHQQQRPAEVISPESESGTEVVVAYPDGWSWRKLLGKEAMIREGEIMGHCVGRLGYYEQVIRAKTTIISLRDAQNVPHVTIEIDDQHDAVKQIRGKQNTAVIDKYLPRVADFLKSRNWIRVAFDGARALTDEIVNYHRVHAPAIYTAHGYRVVYNLKQGPAAFGATDTAVHFVLDGKIIGNGLYTKAQSLYYAYAEAMPSECCEMLRDFCYEYGLRIDEGTSRYLLDKTQWTNNARGWCAADNEAARRLCVVLGNVDRVLLYEDAISGWLIKDATLVLQNSLSDELKRSSALACGVTPKTILFTSDWIQPTRDAPELQTWLAKQNAGKAVSVDTDETLLNSILTALNQPNAADVKQFYLRLKNETVLTDQKMKACGFVTSGRSINAVGAVLMCSLPVKNSLPFKRYVFTKPNMLTCWQEVVTTPDHLTTALRQYGLSDGVIHQILDLLRNEFLRLVPTKKEELAELDLEGGVEMRVKKVIAYAASHKQDVARSKRLWSSL